MRALIVVCVLAALTGGCSRAPRPAASAAPAVSVPPGTNPVTARNMQNMPADIQERLRAQGKIR